MIGQIDPFAPLAGTPAPAPLLPPVPPQRKGGLSPKVMQAVQASFQAPDPVATPPAPPKGTAQSMQLKPGWGGGR